MQDISKPDHLQFWGKAQPGNNAETSWHPLAYHCLDVAACGRVLLEGNRLWRKGLARMFALHENEALALVTFLLALHDVGKFSKPFQAKAPAAWPASILGPLSGYRGSGLPPHDTAGWWLCDQALDERFCAWSGLPVTDFEIRAAPLLCAVTGHHGSPPQEPEDEPLVDVLGKACIDAAISFTEDVQPILLPDTVSLADMRERDAAQASFALAGLATLADWIGSNQGWFTYTAPQYKLDEYWQEVACPRAKKAVHEAGLSEKKVASVQGYQALADIEIPTPMQDWAQHVALPEGPSLFVIEDVTGAGKTEAALMLAHRLMAAGKADGVYFALPTMATANAMYDRLAKVYLRLFADEAHPSLVLAHGRRDLSRHFQTSILPVTPNSDLAAPAGRDADMTASAQCAAWIADDRRLAFLADIGAGSIDQALYSVLPVRHEGLRLAGLMRRVVILDEVHAYDAYMLEEIRAFLQFHFNLGGSAILLSATLPEDMRQRLCDIFSPAQTATTGAHAPYPLATCASPLKQEHKAIAAAPSSVRRVDVRFLSSPTEAESAVITAAKQGQAVLYLRNTVNDALQSHAALKGKVAHLDLFHARFAFCDRLDIEEAVVARFGKKSNQQSRAGHVLVATQVVEQSLDLDFDLVISDLAPIDLLIQRAGRLWRHPRKNRPGKCEFLVVTPDAIADPPSTWIKAVLPGTAAVYKDHGRLWLSASILQRSGTISTPNGVRDLVQSVYGPGAEAHMPESLRKAHIESEGAAGADRGMARYNVLKPSNGYRRNVAKWGPDEHTPTRLAEPASTFRLAKMIGGKLVPWAPPDGLAPYSKEGRQWRLSEINLAKRLADGVPEPPPALASQVETTRQSWGRWQQSTHLLLLEEDTDQTLWRGKVTKNGDPRPIVYSARQGLIFREE